MGVAPHHEMWMFVKGLLRKGSIWALFVVPPSFPRFEVRMWLPVVVGREFDSSRVIPSGVLLRLFTVNSMV